MARPQKLTPLARAGRRLARLGRRFGVGRLAAIVLLSLFVMLRLWDHVWGVPPIETLRVKVFDLYQQIQPREAGESVVAVVDVDEKSLAALGQWPWPRTVVAQIVDQLHAYGVAAIGFDVVFAEADRTSPGLYADSLTGVDESVLDALRTLPNNDEVFAKSIAKGRVVLGQAGAPRLIERYDTEPRYVNPAKIGGDPSPFLHKFPGIVRNIPVLEQAAAGVGMFNLVPELDGLVRRVPLLMEVTGKPMPTLSLELLRIATGKQTYAVKRDNAGIYEVVIAGVVIPTDQSGRIWVRYGPSNIEDYVPAVDVLNGTADPHALAGKLVLIGTSAEGLLDIKATPVHPSIPGVGVHQQILETILSQSYLERPTELIAYEVAMLLAVGLFLIAIVPALGAFLALVLGAAAAAGVVGTSWYLFTQKSQLLDVSYTLAVSLTIYVLLVFVNYFREESRRRQVRGAFSQYLSPALVDQLAGDPDRLVLGGETKEMTFLFSDVRGFTTISEAYKSDPQGLTRLMNGFLTPLTRAILATNGTIDKYMGDAIMAFWNAPLNDLDHPRKACDAALAMLVELQRVNQRFGEEAASRGQPFTALRVGIGINTGSCVVGNMGSDQRFDYSVLGDSVNLASRLEGQSKLYGVDIVMGSKTVAAVEGDYAFMELDLITVKGKTEPERIFALFGTAEAAQEKAFQDLKQHNTEMLDAYRGQDWDKAEALLDAMLKIPFKRLPRDLLTLHRERIHAFRATPPGDDWDGVFVATSK